MYKQEEKKINEDSLKGFCRWSLGVGIPLAIVWAGGIVLVMLGGLGVSMCLQQIEFYIVVGTLWNLIVATPGASLFMTIMIVGNIGVLTQYLEKEIRSTGALIACAYLIVWTVPFGCLGYNIFGYIGLLPLLGVLSVPVFRLCVGSMLLGMGHAGVFVRSFETFIEDFRAGIFLLWHGLRYKNWSEGTKVQFFNALGLIAFFVMAVTHQEVYLMASPETWEDVFRALKWQDIPTRDGSWRDIPINQLIGEKGEIKISLQEATPDEVKRILFWRLGEAPEALGAAGYGIWHIALGFIGGMGTCLSLYLLFKGGSTPPPPPPKGPAGGDKGTNQGMETNVGKPVTEGGDASEGGSASEEDSGYGSEEDRGFASEEDSGSVSEEDRGFASEDAGIPEQKGLVNWKVSVSSWSEVSAEKKISFTCEEVKNVGLYSKAANAFFTTADIVYLETKEEEKTKVMGDVVRAWDARVAENISGFEKPLSEVNKVVCERFANLALLYSDDAWLMLMEDISKTYEKLKAMVDRDLRIYWQGTYRLLEDTPEEDLRVEALVTKVQSVIDKIDVNRGLKGVERVLVDVLFFEAQYYDKLYTLTKHKFDTGERHFWATSKKYIENCLRVYYICDEVWHKLDEHKRWTKDYKNLRNPL